MVGCRRGNNSARARLVVAPARWPGIDRFGMIEVESGGANASGGATVNQAELRQMAEERIKDAKALIDGGRWEFAYYATGYAVECALKSCLLARMIHTGWVFQEKVKVDECLTHDFQKLI